MAPPVTTMTVPAKISLESDNPIVIAILGGKANLNIKLMAARGTLPVPAFDLLHLLYVLALDPDPAVQKAARESAWSIDETFATTVLSDRATDPNVIDAFARINATRDRIADVVAVNPSTPIRTLLFLAPKVKASLLDVLVTNQVLLIENPELMDAILTNPAATPDIRRRIQEIREEFFFKRDAEAVRVERETEDEARKKVEVARRAEEGAAAAARAEKEAADAPPSEARDHERSGGFHALTPQAMMEMSVPEKMERALKGTKGDRALLIMDGNKVVREAVLSSPKVSDTEVEAFAAMRNLPEEMIRAIGNSREWTKNYGVVLNLVKNPKCPVTVSLRLLPRLSFRDMKVLSTDKNISDVVRKAAKTVIDRKATGAPKK